MDSALTAALSDLVTTAVASALRDARGGEGLPGYALTFVDAATKETVAEDRWMVVPVIGGIVCLYPGRPGLFGRRSPLSSGGEEFLVQGIVFDPGSSGREPAYVPDIVVHVARVAAATS